MAERQARRRAACLAGTPSSANAVRPIIAALGSVRQLTAADLRSRDAATASTQLVVETGDERQSPGCHPPATVSMSAPLTASWR